jgi:hypothetical protein
MCSYSTTSRGGEVEDYHSSYLPPSHLVHSILKLVEDVFGANAMINIGTLGARNFYQEELWDFRKMIGLSSLTNIPNITPYFFPTWRRNGC